MQSSENERILTQVCIYCIVEGGKTSGIVIQLLLLMNVNKLVKTQKHRELLMVSGHYKRIDGKRIEMKEITLCTLFFETKALH